MQRPPVLPQNPPDKHEHVPRSPADSDSDDGARDDEAKRVEPDRQSCFAGGGQLLQGSRPADYPDHGDHRQQCPQRLLWGVGIAKSA